MGEKDRGKRRGQRLWPGRARKPTEGGRELSRKEKLTRVERLRIRYM